MSIRFAILALLGEQPMHGYAIRAALDERCVGLCEPDDGEVYRVLASPRRDGLVELVPSDAGGRRTRKVHAITTDGRRALRAWLLAVPEPPARARAELPLRLVLAERGSPELLARVVELHAERGRSDLAELLALRRPEEQRTAASFTALVRAAHVESSIRLARASLDAIELWRAMLGRYRGGSVRVSR